jgi:membrane protease YdiL (CAAX protease family)
MLKEFLLFIFKLKIPNKVSNIKVFKKIFLTIVLFFVMVPVTILSSAISATVEQVVNSHSAESQTSQIAANISDNSTTEESLNLLINNSITLFVLGVIFAPVVEELVFRRGLIKQDISYYFLIIGFLLNTFVDFSFLPKSVVDSISANIIFEILFALVKATILIGGMYFLGKVIGNSYKDINSNLINAGRKHIKLLVLLSSLIFGLVHANNYGFFASIKSISGILLLPFVVVPQLIAGFELAYLAMRFGLRYSMLSHALNNFILVFLPALFSGIIALGGTDILNNPNITDEQLLTQGGPALIGSVGLIVLVIFVILGILFSWGYALLRFNKKGP